MFAVRVDSAPRALLDEYVTWLAPEERVKHGKMATERLRDEYVVTRALSRWVLSRYEPQVTPAEWRFERTEAGRPFVVGPRPAPTFSLSNGGGLVVCAASRHPVGVDVEPLSRGTDLLVTAPRLFSSDENAALAELPKEERARRAVELWTTKEAYLKARGEGISVRLSRFSIAAVDRRAYRLGEVSVLADDPRDWQLEVRELPGEAEACFIAVAVRRGRASDVPVELDTVVPA